MHSAGTPGGGTAAAPPKKFAVLGAVGAVIALAGSCVNWVVSTSDSADGGVKGIDGDGIITLIIALVGAVLMLAALATKKGVLYLIGAATGLATAIVLAINMASPSVCSPRSSRMRKACPRRSPKRRPSRQRSCTTSLQAPESTSP
ncbi:hypothetical protein [Streptomyces sp. RTd22]|uniref:hypothetical protein n=1 Tax=Streptomyces sp. RTd22 TaxID=1841249 RepID=UPI001F436DE8|nr:hypothetical protein [Streptomyces sp. RTd22]